jgi:hypothetical protein
LVHILSVIVETDGTKTPRLSLSIFAGRKGHVATLDCLKTTIGTELQLKETVHDVHFLHNETMFAVAQNKYTYIYDNQGIEIHCMKRHERPYKLDFLPYHFLLTTIGQSGWIKWHDVSIGEYVSGFSTGFGPSRVLKHNPINAVSHVGHSNGVVSLWSPSAGKALVSIFCHAAPVTDLAVDREGRYMVTTGLDGFMKAFNLNLPTINLYIFEVNTHSFSLRCGTCASLGVCTGIDWTSPPPRWTSLIVAWWRWDSVDACKSSAAPSRCPLLTSPT